MPKLIKTLCLCENNIIQAQIICPSKKLKHKKNTMTTEEYSCRKYSMVALCMHETYDRDIKTLGSCLS